MNKIFKEEVYDIPKDQNLFPNWQELCGKTILITGATSGLLIHFITFLLRQNYKYNLGIKLKLICRNLEKTTSCYFNIRGSESIQYIVHDIQNHYTESEIIQIGYFDILIHGAANVNRMLRSDFPVDTLRTNLLGTYNLLEIMTKQTHPTQFIFLSSASVYGEVNPYISSEFSEDKSGNVENLTLSATYSESKRMSETMCIAYSKQFGINIKILRLCSLYGSEMDFSRPAAIQNFILDASNGTNIEVMTPNVYKQLISYSDCARAILFIIILGRDEVYNVATSDYFSLEQIANLIAKVASKPVKVSISPTASKQIYSEARLSTKKLESLGWLPRITFEDGLKEVFDAYDLLYAIQERS